MSIRAIGTAVLLVCGTTACGSDALDPDAPKSIDGRVVRTELPPLSPTVVDAPISYALEPMLTALEQAVPRTFGDIEHRITVPGNRRQSFAFAATRTPFSVEYDGTQLTIATVVSYQGRGWYDPALAPSVSASCGTDGDQPRMRIVITTDVAVTEEWKVRSRTRLRSLRPLTDTDRDACRVSLFRIDVTDKVVNALRPQLRRRLPDVDRNVSGNDP